VFAFDHGLVTRELEGQAWDCGLPAGRPT
jgi:hypothetical protein